jgi:hypothetical protein
VGPFERQSQIDPVNEEIYVDSADCLNKGSLLFEKDASIDSHREPSQIGKVEGKQESYLSELPGSQVLVEGSSESSPKREMGEDPKIKDQKEGWTLGPYEIFVTSSQLRTGIGVAFSAQVSLIARAVLHTRAKPKNY